MTRLLLTAALALAVALPAAAQTFQTDAHPAAGTLRPRADAPAEALDLTVRTVSETGMDDCPGFVDPSAPDAVVEWPGGATLRITTRADFDATLVVARPDGTFACNDDTDGLQPAVEIEQAARGRYAVWIGSFSADAAASQTPNVTLLAGRPAPPPVPALAARPSGGTARLSAGFEAQDGPTTREVAAGGLDAVSAMSLQTEGDEFGGCVGFVDASAPSLVVSYDGDGPLAITATSADQENATDLVLMVHTPAGTWSCNDDYASSDPTVVFEQAARGDYAVWAGTYQPLPRRATTRATVTVSETAPEMPDYGDDYGGYDDYGEASGPYSEGTYMSLLVDQAPAARIAVGAETAEVTASVVTTGTNPVSGPNCVGYLASSPTADVVMSGGGPFGITAVSNDTDDDLVMVVRTPSGRWFCSDDADNLDPGIQFGVDADSTAENGTYRVWVGSFRTPPGIDGMDEMPDAQTGPSSVTVRAERGVVVEWTETGMDDMGSDQPDFTDGTYEGTDLRPDAPMTTLALQDDAGTAAVTAGGTLINPVSGDACAGFVDARPTFAVTAAGPLRISATADEDDLVMVVQTPSGQWLCSDDADGSSNPAVSTEEAGRHAVWVGTFSRRPEGAPATATVAPDDGM